MAYSATLADMRGLTSDAEHRQILDLFSLADLPKDHDEFNGEIMDKGTAAVLQTRDGLLRAAVPNPVGACTFLNKFKASRLNEALKRHKELMKEFPRNGKGIGADVDASDTCFTETTIAEARAIETAAEDTGVLNGGVTIHGSKVPNGHTNGFTRPIIANRTM